VSDPLCIIDQIK